MHNRTKRLAAATSALLVAGATFAAAPATAAGSKATLEAGDDRAAKAAAGSPTECGKGKNGIGVGGTRYGKNLADKKPWADPTTPLEWDEGTYGANNLDILFVRKGFKLLGVAVAALDEKNYNLYTQESLGEKPAEGYLNLHPPTAKKGAAKIKHWFVCVEKG